MSTIERDDTIYLEREYGGVGFNIDSVVLIDQRLELALDHSSLSIMFSARAHPTTITRPRVHAFSPFDFGAQDLDEKRPYTSSVLLLPSQSSIVLFP